MAHVTYPKADLGGGRRSKRSSSANSRNMSEREMQKAFGVGLAVMAVAGVAAWVTKKPLIAAAGLIVGVGTTAVLAERAEAAPA